MDEKVKVGVIGLGSIANIAELPSLARMKDIEIVAALDQSKESLAKAAAMYNIANLCSTFEDFLKVGMDCAFVMTPKKYHTEYVMGLLKNKIDIFCEKPMAMTLQECEKMVNATEDSGKIMMVGFNRRYAPVYRKAKEVYAGKHPDVCLAEKSRNGTEFRATLENAIHMVDLMRWFCGEAVSVEAHAQYEDIDYENTCTAQIKFDSGSIGMLIANRGAGQWTEHLELYGSKKSVIVDSPDTISIISPESEERISQTPLALGWARVEDKMGFYPEAEHFIDCVRTRREPLTSAKDAYKTHLLMDRILKTAGLPGIE